MDETLSPLVLVIDDEIDFLYTLGMLLRNDDYRVLTAQEARTGFQMVLDEKPDIILLDVMMPGLSGYEMIKKLKSNALTKRIPVIIVTAKDKMEDDFLSEGAAGFVVKPYEYKNIKTLIESTLHLGKE
jgi:CheY-like chemotaxis protein